MFDSRLRVTSGDTCFSAVDELMVHSYTTISAHAD